MRKFRRLARQLAANRDESQEKTLLNKMVKLGLLNESATLDDVLGLNLEMFLDRRLQTVLFKKGLASSPKQARQFIVHGHVRIGERKITYPSYIVPREEELKIKVNVQPVAKKV